MDFNAEKLQVSDTARPVKRRSAIIWKKNVRRQHSILQAQNVYVQFLHYVTINDFLLWKQQAYYRPITPDKD